MKLGFDLDEVVVNLTAEFTTYLDTTYGVEWTIDDFTTYDIHHCTFTPEDEDLNNRIRDDLKEKANDPDFQFAAEPYKEAQQALMKLKRDGHKIFFITSRPKQNQPLTYRWLHVNDIPFDKLFVLGHEEPKGPYGWRLKLDMYVDDHIDHLVSMQKYKKRWRKGLLLLDKPWNGAYIDASRYTRVGNWKDILRHVGVQNR